MKPLNLCKGILALSLLFSFCVLSNAQEPIDTSLEELPRHYTGVECSKLYDALVGYQARLRKDEFETTAQFNKRTQEESKKPLLGSIGLDGKFALNVNLRATYDADKEIMAVELSLPYACLSVISIQKANLEFVGLKERNFTESLKMDIPTAKDAKPNLAAIVVVNLVPPYLADNENGNDIYSRRYQNILLKPSEIWIYHKLTGQIFNKLKPENYRKKNEQSGGGEPDVLSKARDLYSANKDEEALAELRRLLTLEPMNADAYLLIGLIQQRQNNLDQAIRALKTALFWNSKLIAAQIMLGRIFLARKDCPQALTYSQSALKLEPNNTDALALQRAIDTDGCR